MPLLDLGRVVRSVRHRVSKDPSFRGRYGLLAPILNDLGQGRVQRNIVLGVFGLDVIDSPAHEAALNEELILFKIEVVPLKRRDLAHAKTEALGDLNHRAIRLRVYGTEDVPWHTSTIVAWNLGRIWQGLKL